MKKLPKLQQMLVFQSVTDMGSIRAAAAILHVSQPALTRSLKELEEYVGVELVIRGTNGITLTDIGKVFKTRVQQIIKDVENSIKEIEHITKFNDSTISFGFSSSLIYTVLPEAVRRFQEYFPKTNIKLTEGQLTELLPALRTGQLDFAISIIVNDISMSEFALDSLFTIPFCIVARKGHPLEHSTSIAELKDAHWCLPSDQFGYQKQVETVLFSQGCNNPILRGDSGQIRTHMTLNADYLMLAPVAILNDPCMKNLLTVIKVKEKIPDALYCVIYQAKFPLSPVSRWLIDEFKRDIEMYCRT